MKVDRETTHLPPGVRVYVSPESRTKRKYENCFLDEAERWGYEELDLPTLDYFESITRGISEDLASRTYQFHDDEGELLALRPDATAQVAKILSGRFSGKDLAGRYCYSCRNYRTFELRRGELREFQQFGAEILGDNRYQSDIELLLFMFELLDWVGHDNVILDLGHVQIYKGLIEDADLTHNQRFELRRKIHRKNVDGLELLLDDIDMSDQRKRSLLTLPSLYGGVEIFDEISEINGISDRSKRSIEYLHDVFKKLQTAGYEDMISLDFGVVRDLDYYSGIVFEALLPGIGKPIVGGGRYDNLYNEYGESMPATGFAIQIDRILSVVHDAPDEMEEQTVWCPEPTPDALEALRGFRDTTNASVIFDSKPETESGPVIDGTGEIRENGSQNDNN